MLAVVPKTHMPNYGEFYELRHFAVPSRTELGAAAPYIDSLRTFFNPDGCIFSCTDYPDFRFGIEICEDLWVASPPSDKLAAAGALVIVNCSAGDEIIGKADYRKRITEVQSAKNICAYLYCGAGEGESTSDMVFSGHCFAYENGTLLAEKAPFDYANDMLITEIDLGRLLYDRRRVNSFCAGNAAHSGLFVDFSLGFGSCGPAPREDLPETELTRRFPRNPFVPHDENELNARAKDILTIQALGLKRRLEHTHSMSAVIGISGGLDSALAYKRHFPAINWLTSYSEYIPDLTAWYETNVGPTFVQCRNEILNLLTMENRLNEIVKLIGSDVLPDDQKLVLEIARVIRLGFLQQNAFHKEDTYVPMEKQLRMMEIILHLYDRCKALIDRNMPMALLRESDIFEKIISIKYDVANDKLEQLNLYDDKIEEFYQHLMAENA